MHSKARTATSWSNWRSRTAPSVPTVPSPPSSIVWHGARRGASWTAPAHRDACQERRFPWTRQRPRPSAARLQKEPTAWSKIRAEGASQTTVRAAQPWQEAVGPVPCSLAPSASPECPAASATEASDRQPKWPTVSLGVQPQPQRAGQSSLAERACPPAVHPQTEACRTSPRHSCSRLRDGCIANRPAMGTARAAGRRRRPRRQLHHRQGVRGDLTAQLRRACAARASRQSCAPRTEPSTVTSLDASRQISNRLSTSRTLARPPTRRRHAPSHKIAATSKAYLSRAAVRVRRDLKATVVARCPPLRPRGHD